MPPQMLPDGDLIINILDATNLERNLYLTMELLERETPVIVALNMWDDTKHRGIDIDTAKLAEHLGVPVVPTVAVTGEGIKELVNRIPEAASPQMPERTRDERWATVGSIINEIQTITHHHHTWLEHLQDTSIKPLTGLPIAALVLAASPMPAGALTIDFTNDQLFGSTDLSQTYTPFGSGSLTVIFLNALRRSVQVGHVPQAVSPPR